MATWLKQSTAVDVMLGPFLDSTDGNTTETGLTITQPDIRLSKNGGAFAQKSAAQTLTHGENGWYAANLSTTDTNTLGILIVAVHESGALPVWREFNVVPANVYDSFFSTDLLQVDLTQWLGSTPNALSAGRPDVSASTIASGAISGGSLAVSAVTAIRALWFGTASSGSTTTLTTAGLSQSATDHWKGCFLLITSGSIAGQCRLITGFNPTTDTITFAPATTAAVSTNDFEILPAARVDLNSWLGSVVNSLVSGRVDSSVGAIAADTLTAAATSSDFLAEINAEVDTALADYDAPTFAELDARTDAIEADTQDIQSRLPAALVSGRVDASVGAMAANVITDAAMATELDSYTMKLWVIRDSSTADRYGITFWKNNVRITSGITGAVIQVVKGSDGTDLIASTALTEIGSTGRYKRDETTNTMVAGQLYFLNVQATIDGTTREWDQQIGRDAT